MARKQQANRRANDPPAVLVEQIGLQILTLRGQRVLLDSQLAALYEQVRRNLERFPEDFLFQLSRVELENWRSQIATSNSSAKMGLRRRPYAFTEHGAIMAATVLNSPRAVEVSLLVVRAFVKLRQFAMAHSELAAKLEQLENKVTGHDDAIRQIVEAIRGLMTPPPDPPRLKIGFARGGD